MNQHRAGSLLHRTVQAIGRAIVMGHFPAQVVLPVEDDLAIRFGVGRNVVREAVKILGEKRLLRTERRSGTVVLPETEWNFLDSEIIDWTLESAGRREWLLEELTALRAIIEPEAAALAARNGSSTDTLRLFAAVEMMEAAVRDDHPPIEADILFHQRLFEATHNRLLLSLVRTVTAVLRENLALALKVKQKVPHNLGEHRSAAEAVHRRNSSAARQMMHVLLANNARRVAEMRTIDTRSKSRPALSTNLHT